MEARKIAANTGNMWVKSGDNFYHCSSCKTSGYAANANPGFRVTSPCGRGESGADYGDESLRLWTPGYGQTGQHTETCFFVTHGGIDRNAMVQT